MQTIFSFIGPLLFVTGFCMPVAPQTIFTGDALPTFLGKNIESAEVKELISMYALEKANPTHYLSKKGIELIFKNSVLTEINLYQQSGVYGAFTEALPRKLKFGKTIPDVRQILGKPKEFHMGNGYCEYEYANYFLSCWFDAAKLSQISITIK